MSEQVAASARDLGGIPIITSGALPIAPSDGAVARRIVRHGLTDVLRWLGEDVGPKPTDQTHVVLISGTLHASAAIMEQFRAMLGDRGRS